MKRRDFFKKAGLTGAIIGTTPLLGFELDNTVDFNHSNFIAKSVQNSLDAGLSKPISVIVIGAGARGGIYANYAKQFPGSMDVVGVSDILSNRAENMAKAHKIKNELVFGDWSEVFKSETRLADAVIISTPDDVHYEPCMKALNLGYHVLLEKPVAQTAKQCIDIKNQAKKYNRMVAVAHVLRYAPYFNAIREAIQTGQIGEVISIQHLEPIEAVHMTHSYVRGIFKNSKTSNPIILAKSCHDLDIILYMIDKKCTSISADGNLKWFKKENAPKAAPQRCTDGCPHEPKCPWSAIKIYHQLGGWNYGFDFPGGTDQEKLDFMYKKIQTNDYGKCVYHSDNDQCDHYVANMVFEDDITCAFSMEAFTSIHGRRTRIFGSEGYLEGDMEQFIITNFVSRNVKEWNKKTADTGIYANHGHGGGDDGLMRDFLKAVGNDDAKYLTSSIDKSVESHLMGFAAEESRKNGNKIMF